MNFLGQQSVIINVFTIITSKYTIIQFFISLFKILIQIDGSISMSNAAINITCMPLIEEVTGLIGDLLLVKLVVLPNSFMTRSIHGSLLVLV